MARTIHTLKSAEPRKPAVTPAAVDEEEITIKLHEEVDATPMSYIEVGGKSAVEGSADVMSVPLHGLGKPTRLERPSSPPTTEQDCWELQFQPWPDAEERLPSPVAADIVAFHRPDHPLCGQFRSLLNNLLLEKATTQFLYVTSLDRELEVTNIVVNLSILAARELQKRVVILDFNNRPRSATDLCGLQGSPNLTDVVAGRVALENVPQVTAVTGLSVVKVNCPTGKTWQKELLEWVFEWLRGRYDLVFVDFSPLELKKEIMAVASFCDTVIPVFREDGPVLEGKPLLEELARHVTQLRGYICCKRALR